MKVSKTKNRFKTGFQQPKTGFPKTPVLTSLIKILKKKIGHHTQYHTATNKSMFILQNTLNRLIYK